MGDTTEQRASAPPGQSARHAKRPQLLRRASVAWALLLVAGCGVLTPEGGPELDRLAAAEARWAARGPDRYRVTVERLCFCPLVVARLAVEGGTVVEITFPEGENGGPPQEWWDDYARDYLPPVEVAFERIREVLRDKPHSFEGEYRDSDGLPLEVSVDPLRTAADDEWTLRYRDLEALEAGAP